MRYLFLMLLSATVLCAQPHFTYNLDAAAAAGLNAHQHQSRGHLAGDLEPFLVTIENTSGRAIGSMVVKYSYKVNLTGSIVDSGALVMVHQYPSGSPTIRPGNSITFYPFGGPARTESLALGASTVRRMRQVIATAAGPITATVDAIVFDDGEIVGPDTAGLGARLEAERATIGKVRHEFSEAQGAGLETAYVERLAATQQVDPLDLLSMGYSPTWEAHFRWILGQSMKHSPNEQWIDRLGKMEESAHPLFRKGQLQ